jgi:fimbrial chaperone protein
MSNVNRWIVLPLLLLLSWVAPASAFQLSPIEAEFAAGRQAVQLFKLENEGTETVAIEISVHRRDMAADGSDQLTAAPDDFVVYPDQILLAPGTSQSVRVQWTGASIPDQELAYRLVAEQLAIDMDSAQAERSGLRLMVKYLASLYVRPASPAAVLSADAELASSESKSELILSVANTGNAHAILRADMFRLSLGSQPVELSPEQREVIDGRNVLAGVTRELRLPWSGNTAGAELEVQLVALDGAE